MRSAPAVPAVLSLLLFGCAARDPRPSIEPSVELQRSFDSRGLGAQALEVGDRWWETFGDPELTALVERALENNLSLRMAWARMKQMRALARAAGSARYPNVDLAASVERQELEGDVDTTVDTAFASLTVGYQVDLWGKISSSYKAALLDGQASRSDLEATALALTGSAGELWFTIAASQATLRLLDEQVKVGEDILGMVERRFANGLASASDVLSQRLHVETTRGQIPWATSELAALEHQLAVLLGSEPQAPTPHPATELPVLPPVPQTGVPIEVLRARPDVRAAELRVAASDQRLAVALADRYPSLAISAGVGGQGEHLSGLLDSWFLSLGASLLTPVFDGHRREAEADRSRAVVEEALYAWESTLLVACAEVESALARERGLLETTRILAVQLDLGAENLSTARALYRSGLTDSLTVLIALQSLQDLQRQAISTRADLLRNRIGLHLALGGSWFGDLEDPTESAEE